MASTEKRQLEIAMRLKDFVSGNLSKVGAAIGKFTTFAGRSFLRVAKALNPLTLGVSAFVAAWGALKGGRTFAEILDGVDALDKMGDSLGTQVGRMEQLRGAFEIAGIGGERFNAIMTGLGRSIGAVLNRNDQNLLRGFEELGVGIDDLRNKDVVGIFEQMSAGLDRFNTAQEKAAALSRFFPDNFQKLFAVVGKGRGEFQNLIELARLFVGTITEGGAAAAGRLSTAIGLLKTAVQSLGRDAVIQLAERFAGTVERIAVFIAQNRETLAKAIAVIVEGVVNLIRFLAAALVRVAAFLRNGIDPLIERLSEIPVIGKLIADALSKAFNVTQLSAQAKEIREEAVGVAQEVKRLETELLRVQGFPSENDPTGRRVQLLQEQIADQKNKLQKLAGFFSEAAPNAGDLFAGALDTAALNELADLISTGFDDLPGLSVNFQELWRRINGGDGDIRAVQQGISDFFSGFSNQLDEVRRKWSDFSQAGRDAAGQLVDNGLTGFANTLADIATRTQQAKAAWTDYARQILVDLARIIARLLIVRAVSSLFGGGGGSVGGETATATAGTASAGAGAALGARLGNETAAPVTLGGSGNAGTTVNFNISAVDGQSVKRMLIEQGDTLAAVIQSKVQGRSVPFRQAMQRATT